MIITKKIQSLRSPERLAIGFFLVATIVSFIYGYSLRFYIFTDLIKKYLMVFPVFLVFLFYSKINNKYLKFGWTILSLGPALFIILAFASSDIHFFHKINLRWIIYVTVFFGLALLEVYLFKSSKKTNLSCQ